MEVGANLARLSREKEEQSRLQKVFELRSPAVAPMYRNTLHDQTVPCTICTGT